MRRALGTIVLVLAFLGMPAFISVADDPGESQAETMMEGAATAAEELGDTVAEGAAGGPAEAEDDSSQVALLIIGVAVVVAAIGTGIALRRRST